MSVSEIASIVFTVAAVGAVLFQLALALGAPWGASAMGGRWPGRFPAPLRVAAVVQAAILAGLAGVVLARAGLALPAWQRATDWLIWVVVAFSVLSLAMNSASRSARERRLWVPAAAVMLASSLTVALLGQ